MALAYSRMLMNELLNKDPEIVLEAAPLFILDSKSDVCMSNNGKDTNHNSHIARRVQFVRNGEKCKLHQIYWYEGGLQLAYIATKNFVENNLNLRMKYIMLRLYNW